MPDEYIKRSDAISLIVNGNELIGRGWLIKELATLPAADVEPVRHGWWERKPDPYGFFDTIPVCSVCGCTTKYREESMCCPHCGAKMDAEPPKEDDDAKVC